MLRLSVLAALLPLFLWAANPPESKPTSLGPVLEVHLGTALLPGSHGIPNRTGTVDLGTSAVAKIKATTFTVHNAGTANLTLGEPIRLPRGFTLVRSFGKHTLTPGQSTQFVAALNSAQAGRLGGPISFGTNGSPGNQFSFTVTGTAFGPPSMRIIDNGDPSFRPMGRWTVMPGRGFQGTIHVSSAGQGTNRASWTFGGLKPGLYQVSATWSSQSGQATNARFTVANGTRAVASVAVNQSLAPRDFQDAGTSWHNLGRPFRIIGDRLEVGLSDLANGPVVADAVRIERVGYPGRIIANADPGFQSAGDWVAANVQGMQARSERSSAAWTFTGLIPGQYRVSTTWPATARGSASAPFTILDGDRVVARVGVNQLQAPRDLRDAGTVWTDLGGVGALFPIQGKSLVVRLSNADSRPGPGNNVVTGPMRIERIYNPAGGRDAGPLISTPDIVRLLEQATWGPNDNLIAHVRNDLGGNPQAFLDEQFNAPTSGYPTPPDVPDDANAFCHGDETCRRDNYTLYPMQNRLFTNALYQPDQLRQRAAFILHQIIIISGATDDQVPHPNRYTQYLQIFDRNAFGNYRQILYEITRSACMGHYLNLDYSTTQNMNENYAREILQLFSVGLNMLNPDGTLQLDGNGDPIPTYTQDTVNNFTKVFTGWTYAPPRTGGITNFFDPMAARTPETAYHNQSAKTLLQYPGAVNGMLPPSQATLVDLNQALDNIINHPSIGPFISQQFIQKLVTSNPSPAYVARVAAVFNDDGTGVRGNLRAMLQAILLDPEARGDMALDPAFGHLRDPILHTCNLLRAFNATSYDGASTSDGYVNIYISPLGMDLFRAPTVFSYYPPSFNAPGYAPLLGPEFAILDSVTTLKRANFINQMTFGNGIRVDSNAPRGTALNLTALQAMTPDAMADYLNTLLLHGTMSDPMRTALIQAIATVPAANPLKRARTAVYLVTTSAQYDVQQ